MATTNTTPSIMTLFGPSSLDEYQMQRQQSDMAKAMAMAEKDVDPVRQAMAYGGMQLGRGVNQLLGAPDPELDRQTKLMQVQKEVEESGVDPSNWKMALPTLAKTLQKYGLNKESMLALDHYRQFDLAERKQAADTMEAEARRDKLLQEKDTRIRTDKDFAVFAGDLGFGVKPFLSDYTQPEITAVNKAMREFKIKHAEAGASNITAIGGKAYGQEAGKEAAKASAGIEGDYSSEDSYKEAIASLRDPKTGKFTILAGGYGPAKEFAAKYAGIGSKEKLINTEAYRAKLAHVVVPYLKKFGGNDTEEERKYIENFVAGNTKAEPETLERNLKEGLRKTQLQIERTKRNDASVREKGTLTTDPGPSREQPQPRKRVYVIGKGFVEQ